jgi:hypothetical protein
MIAAQVLRALRMVGLEMPLAAVHRGERVRHAAKRSLKVGSRPGGCRRARLIERQQHGQKPTVALRVQGVREPAERGHSLARPGNTTKPYIGKLRSGHSCTGSTAAHLARDVPPREHSAAKRSCVHITWRKS